MEQMITEEILVMVMCLNDTEMLEVVEPQSCLLDITMQALE